MDARRWPRWAWIWLLGLNLVLRYKSGLRQRQSLAKGDRWARSRVNARAVENNGGMEITQRFIGITPTRIRERCRRMRVHLQKLRFLAQGALQSKEKHGGVRIPGLEVAGRGSGLYEKGREHDRHARFGV
ncbi:hypothetical protein DFP72DRAFT_853828 [Ephemerocybe angulata]|uniref:Secreted protein n=1 Tax=Ephemerocybe angulata TaxID=980116 RepID=A0A8H6HJH9_9AGAR|nr:hypothetical protein DFP72DRAFT_853828 [Tulosesus angulatus]